MSKVVTLCAMILIAQSPLFSLPQFALLSGNRCSSCHVTPGSGGGMRNDLGWYSYNDVGIIPREGDPLGWMYAGDESNKFLDDMFSWGMDIRVQNTRSFSSPDAGRVTFPMQAEVYGSFSPIKALTLEGGYNLASLRQSESGAAIRFPGQRAGHFSLISTIDLSLPTIRVGLFRPSVGVRYDDHTMFPYSYVTRTGRQNYFSPGWAEYGSELTWESEKWLTAQVGLFGTSSLQQVQISNGQTNSSIITGNSPTVTARAVLWNRFDDDAINTNLGGSILLNNDLSIVSIFGGIGLTDHLSLMLDVTSFTKTNVQSSTTYMAELMYALFSPVMVYTRYEFGNTKQQYVEEAAEASSIILGTQIFLLPYVELRPEYRIFDTHLPGYVSRWNVQLHIFY